MSGHNLLFSLNFCLLVISASGQSGTITAGGDIKTESGSISSSIGQVIYVPVSNAAITPGLQQTFKVVAIKKPDITISVFPNPSVGNVTLRLGSSIIVNHTYQINDLQGKKLQTGIVSTAETLISFSELSVGAYILTVFSGSAVVGQFKIIKYK